MPIDAYQSIVCTDKNMSVLPLTVRHVYCKTKDKVENAQRVRYVAYRTSDR